MKTKRYLTMMIVIALLTGCLAGCGQGKRQQSSEQSKQGQSESSVASGQSQASSEEAEKGPITTDPVTISIFTSRQNGATNDAEDIWFFQYLEYWLAEQGYNVTIDVRQSAEYAQQISLMLGTGTLPDLIWGPDISAANMVTYGAEAGVVLDWSPYINEETMPNLYNAFQNDPDALVASTCSDGAIYGLPYFTSRSYGGPALSFGMVDRMYVNEKWLKECGLDMPTDIDGFLDMLRTFKDKIKLDDGNEVIPLISLNDFFEKYLWLCMGYYGGWLTKYGETIAIKDGEIVMPVYSEDYKTFIKVMKTCYDEGLISPDYFTMDNTSATALAKAGVNGVWCNYTLNNLDNFADYVEIPPFSIGDNDEIAISLDATYKLGGLWASADTEYPELLALIADYLYSEEGNMYYRYGPMKGQDPLKKLDGWYYDDNGKMTTKLVEDGTFANFGIYASALVRSSDYVGNHGLGESYARQLAGLDSEHQDYEITDAITGKQIKGKITTIYSHDDVSGHWRLASVEAVEPYLTTVRVPSFYLSEEDTQRMNDLSIVLNEHIASESAKFITGIRSIDELDTFLNELKSMGIEEYIEINKKASAFYMESIFG